MYLRSIHVCTVVCTCVCTYVNTLLDDTSSSPSKPKRMKLMDSSGMYINLQIRMYM